MSEAFIRRLAGLVVRHQAFTSAVEAAVVEVLTTTLHDELAGQTLRLYIPKTGTHARTKRAREIRALFASGTPIAALATRYGISERQVQRLVAGSRATSSD
jgi:Mor family transcriptional regulator